MGGIYDDGGIGACWIYGYDADTYTYALLGKLIGNDSSGASLQGNVESKAMGNDTIRHKLLRMVFI